MRETPSLSTCRQRLDASQNNSNGHIHHLTRKSITSQRYLSYYQYFSTVYIKPGLLKMGQERCTQHTIVLSFSSCLSAFSTALEIIPRTRYFSKRMNKSYDDIFTKEDTPAHEFENQ